MDPNLKTFLITQLSALLGWVLKDLISMKVKIAKVEMDLDAAHQLIRELKGKS